MVGTMTTWFSMTAVLPELTEEWGLSSAQGSYITIMVQAGFVTGSLLSAFFNLPDRIIPPVLFFWSAVVAGLSTLLTAMAVDNLTAAMLMRFITGMALAGVYGPGLKLTSTWFKLKRGMALGFVVGSLTLGSSAPHLFRGIGMPSWELVLMVSGSASILAGVLVYAAVPVGPFMTPSAPFDPKSIPKAFKNRAVRLANFGYFGHMWELYAMWTWFGLFVTESIIAAGSAENAAAKSSIITFLVVGSGFIGAWAGGVLADKFGREKITLWSLGISGSMTILIGFSFGGAIWLSAIIGIIWGMAIIADSAQFSALVTEHADQRYVGTALTFQLAVGFALTILVILLVPIFETLVGWKYVFLLLLPGPAAGFISMLKLYALTTKHS
ncbi:nitrate/nitrite transporter [Alteribacillus sp. HJP-4]|uniref:MFS transporter n=1 Tax=Alteribacillus sp. HJP-4 TaxID=2775394 RepID=UPI0035CD05CD